MDVMMSVMLIAAILGAADINNVCGYYYCSDGPKYVRGYNDLPSHYYCGLL
jgi:hypothetical protein